LLLEAIAFQQEFPVNLSFPDLVLASRAHFLNETCIKAFLGNMKYQVTITFIKKVRESEEGTSQFFESLN